MLRHRFATRFDQVLDIKVKEDSDICTHCVAGSKGKMPLALLLLLGSGYAKITERYVQFLNSWGCLSDEFVDIPEKYKEVINDLIYQFNYAGAPLTEDDDGRLEFYVYADKFADLLVEVTPDFDSGKSYVALIAPPNYYEFQNHILFQQIESLQIQAMKWIMQEFTQEIKIRDLEKSYPIDLNDYTIEIAQYEPLEFKLEFGHDEE
jgi:hypothetical protein